MAFNLGRALRRIYTTTERLFDTVDEYDWCRGNNLFLMASAAALGMIDEDRVREHCYEALGQIDRRWGMRQVTAAANKLGILINSSGHFWDWDFARQQGYEANSPLEALTAAVARLQATDAYRLVKEMLGQDVADVMHETNLATMQAQTVAAQAKSPGALLQHMDFARWRVAQQIEFRGGTLTLLVRGSDGVNVIIYNRGNRMWWSLDGRQWRERTHG